MDGWDEIGTDTSDTEYIQQMDNELEKLGVGSFDPELCDEYVSCVTVFVDLIHCAFVTQLSTRRGNRVILPQVHELGKDHHPIPQGGRADLGNLRALPTAGAVRSVS